MGTPAFSVPSLEAVARSCEVVVVVGGRNSNNTRELAARVESLGARAFHVERPEDIDPRWFEGVEHSGVTAGTSTLDETVDAVVNRLRLIAATDARKPAPWI